MVGEIASRHALSDEMIDGVSERTGGVPLFVEEVTRLLLERDDAGRRPGDPADLAAVARRAARPARRSARSRADRRGAGTRFLLPAAQRRVVDRRRIRRAARCKPRWIGSPKPTSCSSTAPLRPPTYRFKHALIQDAAYDSLLKSRRQALHRRAAEALRDANAEPEAIAHHFTEAGLDDLAIEWWGKAGDQALRRSAFQEAIAHLGKAIAMADKAGGRAAGARRLAAPNQRLTPLHVAYGNALFAARGLWRAGNDESLHPRAAALATRDAPERLAADYGLWVGSLRARRACHRCGARSDLPQRRRGEARFA